MAKRTVKKKISSKVTPDNRSILECAAAGLIPSDHPAVVQAEKEYGTLDSVDNLRADIDDIIEVMDVVSEDEAPLFSLHGSRGKLVWKEIENGFDRNDLRFEMSNDSAYDLAVYIDLYAQVFCAKAMRIDVPKSVEKRLQVAENKALKLCFKQRDAMDKIATMQKKLETMEKTLNAKTRGR